MPPYHKQGRTVKQGKRDKGDDRAESSESHGDGLKPSPYTIYRVLSNGQLSVALRTVQE